MSRQHLPLFIAPSLALGIGLTGCGVASSPQTADTVPTQAAADVATPTAAGTPDVVGDAAVEPTVGRAQSPAALPLLVVTKTPSCGCCHLWVEHMQKAGFKVEIHDVDDLGPLKERVGVPYGKGSCHTAEVGGYFIEGHVPAEDVKRLLVEKPKAKGLTVPGMPMGSPGMETPDGRVQPYVVELVAQDGSTAPFARHGD